jgi:hypothetical protein
MNLERILSKFYQAQSWNAFSYVVYKILFYLVTLTLYKKLSSDDFSQWAVINSTTFLLLLWLDFGLRKSVPRFAPVFAQNNRLNKRFIITILLAKIALLIVATPLFYWYTKNYLSSEKPIIITACILFVSEGMVAILQLIYHAYFWNKQINIVTTAMTSSGMIATLLAIYYYHSAHTLVLILCIRTLASIGTLIISIIMLKYLFAYTNSYPRKEIEGENVTRLFVTHSAAMWVTTTLKSLSERNFLVPLIMHTLGAQAGGIFKVANDGALIFYRVVLKTIGSTDTALLAHVEEEQKNSMNNAFKQLTIRVAALCLPLLGIVGLCSFNHASAIGTSAIFHLFILMTIAYLVETLLHPYERVLEVKRAYAYIAIAYIPYICLVIALASGYLTTLIGLYASVALIHAVRLVSLSIMAAYAYGYYKVIFPLRIVLELAAGCVAFIFFARVTAHFFKINIPLSLFFSA